MDGEGLDVDEGGPQSDEEGFAIGEEEEDFQKELALRLRREHDLANRNVGVLEKSDSGEDSDDDLFGDKAAEKEAEHQAERKRKAKLRRAALRRGDEVPFDDDDLDDVSESVSGRSLLAILTLSSYLYSLSSP